MEEVKSFEEQWQKYSSSNLLLWLLLPLFPLMCFTFIKHKKTKQRKLPPSPPKLPIIGNLHQLGILPHKSLRDLAQKHGPLMFVHVGSARFLVVSSADAVQEITKHHDVDFSNRHGLAALRSVMESGQDLVLSPYGDHWRQAKKISVLHLLSQNVVDRLQTLREEEISVMLETIKLSSLKGCKIDLRHVLLSTVSNVVYRSFTGRRCEERFNGMNFGDWHMKFKKLSGTFLFADLSPSLGWMDRLMGFAADVKNTAAELDGFMDQMIRVSKDCSRGETNFVDILFDLQEDGKLNPNLSFNDIKAMMQTLIYAATDNVVSLMEWTMADLVKHQHAMRKAQEEVRNVVGSKSNISSSDIDQMHYLKCVIRESMRLHPFGIFPRETMEMVKIYGYEIPAKTKVLVNLWAIQRDPEAWENPDEFIPERFENVQTDYKGNQKGFVPFGFGRRYCPGISYALVLLENITANLLCWYNWELPGGSKPEELDMSEIFQLAVLRKYPLELVPCAPKTEG